MHILAVDTLTEMCLQQGDEFVTQVCLITCSHHVTPTSVSARWRVVINVFDVSFYYSFLFSSSAHGPIKTTRHDSDAVSEVAAAAADGESLRKGDYARQSYVSFGITSSW